MNKVFRLTGIVSAPFTPMEENGDIRFSAIGEYAQRLKKTGVAGVFIGGTTGESLSLTIEERYQLAESWIEQQNENFHVIVHAGCESLRDAGKLARHAKQIDAAGVGAMPPVFFKPKFSELVDFCKVIAAACAPLPFYFYHIPSMTGINHSMLELAKVCSNNIENFRGIKYTHNDLVEYSLLCENDGDGLDFLYGRDETLLAGLSFGAKGMIGSTYNYAMPVYRELVKAFRDGDVETARMWQLRSQKIVTVLSAHGGGIGRGKALMKIAGFDAGGCRLPNRKVESREITQARSELEDADVLKYLAI